MNNFHCIRLTFPFVSNYVSDNFASFEKIQRSQTSASSDHCVAAFSYQTFVSSERCVVELIHAFWELSIPEALEAAMSELRVDGAEPAAKAKASWQ